MSCRIILYRTFTVPPVPDKERREYSYNEFGQYLIGDPTREFSAVVGRRAGKNQYPPARARPFDGLCSALLSCELRRATS